MLDGTGRGHMGTFRHDSEVPFLHRVPGYSVNLFILTAILLSMCNTLVKEFVKL